MPGPVGNDVQALNVVVDTSKNKSLNEWLMVWVSYLMWVGHLGRQRAVVRLLTIHRDTD